jgi:hypothetical protein
MARPPLRVVIVITFVALAWAGFHFTSAGASEKVRVYYPAGACETNLLQVERYHRSANRWIAHPDHPQVEGGSCQWEDESFLLNELRVRCIDRNGEKAPSAWVVGVDLKNPTNVSSCRKEPS